MSKQAPASELSALPELVPAQEVARLYGVKVDSLKEMRRHGYLTVPKTVIDGHSYYAREDVVKTYHDRERRLAMSPVERIRASSKEKGLPAPESGPARVSAKPAPPIPAPVETLGAEEAEALHASGVPSPKSMGQPAEVAASYARHFATLLTFEEPESPQWRFLLGQLSAAATLANVLRR